MPWTNVELTTVASAATIALAALFRPDIERLIQRRRAIIDVHPAGRLEVGFGNFGPTIGVQGTLQAIHRDAFITCSSVTVVRVADNLRHEFPWAVFRPQTLGASAQQAEIASGFLLSVSAPRRFNIQFHDGVTLTIFDNRLPTCRSYGQSTCKRKRSFSPMFLPATGAKSTRHFTRSASQR
jgi:hypothetical protein